MRIADEKRADRVCVLISGCHSGPNPSAGLGVARSLRLAYPGARLVAKDYFANASGLHDPVFDAVWVCRPWNELDLDQHRDQIHERLQAQTWLIPLLDAEVRWLAQAPNGRILAPASDALGQTAKPAIAAAEALPVKLPPWLPLSAGEREVHAFCRAQNWRIWIKGSAHEARLVRNWTELVRERERLQEVWGGEDLFAQADVAGWEVSIAFSACAGELLDAVFMEKRLMTEEGKTWAGEILPAPVELLEPLRTVLGELHWTGGGELEFVRDAGGELWLIDWNPRFPAWIFGATVAGHNLPARLVEAASGEPAATAPTEASQFTRVVTEIPARRGLPLPPAPLEKPDPAKAAKHLSGMPSLLRRLARSEPAAAPPPAEPIPGLLAEDLFEACRSVSTTPYRAFLPRIAQEQFRQAALLLENAQSEVRLSIAYSVKTNPAPAFMRLARAHGFVAEVISGAELRWALETGFGAAEIIYNGPVPGHASEKDLGPVGIAFADSPAAFRTYVEAPPARVVGVRLRPPGVESRFGVQMDSPEEFEEIVRAAAFLPTGRDFGVSVHVQSSEVGVERWHALARSAVYFGAAVQELTGKWVRILDLGGGWAAADLESALSLTIPDLVAAARPSLPHLDQVVLEPGKSLVEPCMAVICQVVEIRTRGDGTREAVVDGSIAEVPLVHQFPHRLALRSGGRLEFLGPGADRVLGRLCMENDVLASEVALPEGLTEGDLLCVCDSGGYDASMAYRFGLGGWRAADE